MTLHLKNIRRLHGLNIVKDERTYKIIGAESREQRTEHRGQRVEEQGTEVRGQ